MGLNEKRKLAELQETSFPERTKELLEITGVPVQYDIDWDSFKDSYEAMNFVDNVGCHRINMALRVICGDKVGKQATAEGLKKIHIKNIADKAGKKVTLAGGVLALECAYASGLDGAFSDNEIRKVIEDGL